MGTKLNPGKFDCYENAKDDEPMFVLLARDYQAANLVRLWANLRELDIIGAVLHFSLLVKAAYKSGNENKIQEAYKCAYDMVEWNKYNPNP